MSNWGDGYKMGHKAGIEKMGLIFKEISSITDETRLLAIQKKLHDPAKDHNGGPSQYAVANKCCGGVDAHDVGCR